MNKPCCIDYSQCNMSASLSAKITFIAKVFGQCSLSRDEKNVAVKCPYCGKINSEKKKLVIRTSDTACHCWVCGYKARSLVSLIKKFQPDMLDQYLKEFYTGSKITVEKDLDIQIARLKLPSDFKLLVLSNKKDPDVRRIFDYAVKDRGLDEDDLWRHNVGISNEFRWNYRLLFPSFDKDGYLNYYVARAVSDTRKPKYDAPDVQKLPIIFNEFNLNWNKPLILCEGPLDMVKCGDNAVPLLGSEINETSYLFEKIITTNASIILALDSDMKNKTLMYVKKLESYNIDVSVVDLGKHSDPGSMTKEQFNSLLQNTVKYSWKDRIKSLLSSS